VQTPSRGVCFEHVQNKRYRMAFKAIAQRLHSVSTALLATAQRAPRRSATFLQRCGNAVVTPLWCDRAFTYVDAIHGTVTALTCIV